MKYKRKPEVVEAREYDGPPVRVIHDVLGEQAVSKGDWLVGSERGKVRKMTAAEFHETYEPVSMKVLNKQNQGGQEVAP
jgi:hypothetical protein